MEDNTNMTEQTQAENMGNETEVQGTSEKDQKLFTQEEVNKFVQSRLSREKGQIAKGVQAEYDQKLAELQAREMKVLIKEQLDVRGMPRKLADIITCTDETDLKQKLDALNEIYGSSDSAKDKKEPTGFIQIGASTSSNYGVQTVDPYRKAMGLD